MEEIARGAEAVILEDSSGIHKLRLQKAYRIPAIDSELRKRRTKIEASILESLARHKIPVPKVLKKDGEEIVMEKVRGVQVKEVLDKNVPLARDIGAAVGRMHAAHIIHGDLTTSNMILAPDGVVVLIDFGLSFHSQRIEDMAVDLHLFLQALNSRHHEVRDEAWKRFLEGYRSNPKHEAVTDRLKTVEQRGRYKMKREV